MGHELYFMYYAVEVARALGLSYTIILKAPMDSNADLFWPVDTERKRGVPVPEV